MNEIMNEDNFTKNVEEFITLTDAKSDVAEFLRKTDKLVQADQYLKSFALSIKKIVYSDFERELFSKAIDYAKPWLTKRLGDCTGIFPLYVLATGIDYSIKRYKEAGISLDILKQTLSEPNMAIDYYRNKFNLPGISHYHWTPFYFLFRNFRIGRLNYIAAPYKSNFAVYRNNLTGQKITISTSDVEVLPSGYISGTNGLKDINSFKTEFELTDDYVKGNVVDTVNGVLTHEVIRLKNSEWDALLLPGDPILEVHIPADGRLGCSECEDSFRAAVAFYSKYFPEYHFKAFTCGSWLIDSKLREFLPRESNTVRFMEMYEKYPIFSSKPAIYSWVYDHDFNPDDIFSVPPKTSMQKSLVEYLKNGGEVYTGAGYILKERFEI